MVKRMVRHAGTAPAPPVWKTGVLLVDECRSSVKSGFGVTSRICTGPSAFTELCANYYTMATIDSMVPPTGAAPASSRLKVGRISTSATEEVIKMGPPAWSCTRIFRLSDANSAVELRESKNNHRYHSG